VLLQCTELRVESSLFIDMHRSIISSHMLGSRVVFANSPLIISANSSSDPDRSTLPAHYKWTCSAVDDDDTDAVEYCARGLGTGVELTLDAPLPVCCAIHYNNRYHTDHKSAVVHHILHHSDFCIALHCDNDERNALSKHIRHDTDCFTSTHKCFDSGTSLPLGHIFHVTIKML